MNKPAVLITILFLIGAAAAADIRHLSPDLQKKVAETDYAAVRIKIPDRLGSVDFR